ncbi:MAG: hypothetical protein IID28_01975 [Planctomycetes bacterium]|nr:hypothetical protein [Planctomycetota bacterium]
MIDSLVVRVLTGLVALSATAVAPVTRAAARAVVIDAAVARGVEVLLAGQEGPGNDQWPYEGVYRVNQELPIGYRVGGTAIGGLALLSAPADGDLAQREEALARAAAFVAGSIEHPRMAHRFEATYDVRGWGYVYGLSFLLSLHASDRVPDGLAAGSETAIRFFIAGLEAIAIPLTGGWNYARRAGFTEPGPAASFMTAPALQALFEAKRQGYEVNPEVVGLGLDALERARSSTGAFAYSGTSRTGVRNMVPGAVGRMPAAEVTLYLAGRSELSHVRGAIDAFVVHWQWLEQRRAKKGTHAGRYNIAPYYFYFAHHYAAQAVELLPDPLRHEYRRRIRDLLFLTRGDDGTWNDRVFPRSASYGTSMAIISLMMPESPPLARWQE